MRSHLFRRSLREVGYAGGRGVGSIRLRRFLASSSPPYRVELGAHDTRREGWISTDVWWGARYHLDATGPWPFPPGSVSHVYGDNMIEHVPIDGARALFRHAVKAMRPGGRIRLVTPDVERCAEVYLERGDLARAQLDAHRGAGDHASSTSSTSFERSSSNTSTTAVTSGTSSRLPPSSTPLVSPRSSGASSRTAPIRCSAGSSHAYSLWTGSRCSPSRPSALDSRRAGSS